MASFSDLPEDIMEEIMSRLSPESLLRLKSVKRSLYTHVNTLIKDPKFVAKHLRNSNKNNASCLVFKRFKYCDKDTLGRKRNVLEEQGSLTIFNGKDTNNNIDHPSYIFNNLKPLIFFPKQSTYAFGKIYLVGFHCNGILCIANDTLGRVVLFNPATRDVKFLSDPERNRTIRVGFGHDPIANVYKVVRVFDRFGEFRAQVFTLGDKSWRDIEIRINVDDYCTPTKNQVYSKGVYYWLVAYRHSSEATIHAFDMHSEEFHCVEMPEEFKSQPYLSSYFDTSLLEWNESVALLYQALLMKPTIEIWVMGNRGPSDQIIWTKTMSVDALGFPRTPVAFLGSDELVMKEGTRGIVSYNLRTRKIRLLCHLDMSRIRAIGFVKSLVSLQ